MNPRVNHHDLELLSAYLDDQLPQAEKARLERRLQAEPALNETLAGLRATVRAMRGLPQVKVPRNFMLDPATYGAVRPARAFGPLYGLLRLGTALATALFVVAVAGDFLARSGVQRLAAPAEAPAPAEVSRSVDATPTEALAAAQALVPTPTAEVLGLASPAEAEAVTEEPAAEEGDTAAAPTPPTGLYLEGGGGEGQPGIGGGGEGAPGVGGGGAEGTETPPELAAAPPTMDVAAESTVEARLAAADSAVSETSAPEATQTVKSAGTETEPAPAVAEGLPEAPAESAAPQPEAVTTVPQPFNWLRAAQIAFGALAVALGLAALWYRARAQRG
jgi:hypothetical protein